MKILRSFFAVILFFTFAGVCRDLPLELEYDYMPGEPHWAVYGSIQGRTFNLVVGSLTVSGFGKVETEDDIYRLVPEKETEGYLTKALKKILTGYGIRFSTQSPYTLTILPVSIRITSADNKEDGQKRCQARFFVRLAGPDKKEVFRASVENEGILEIDDDDEEGYADLIDMTIHGAITTLWGSQVLFSTRQLGPGRIIKKSMGTYGFIPYKTAGVPDSGSTSYGKPDSGVATADDHLFEDLDNSNWEVATAGSALNADYAGNDSLLLSEGRKLTLGVLPVENAVGQYALNASAIACRDVMIDLLSRSKTVKVMERDRLEDVLKEQALGLTGIMNDSTVVKVGNISGVRTMLAIKLVSSGGYYRLIGRIINVETSALVASVAVDAPDANSITDAVPELAAKLMLAFTGEKLPVNRNTMSYPTTCPMAVSATTASVEDAWAVEKNPAALMKINHRDAQFFISFASRLKGTLDTQKISTSQPPFSDIGVNLAFPVSSWFATGFGIKHAYTFPALKTADAAYNLKEEKTVFTAPFALGVNPHISLGVNVRLHLVESQIYRPGHGLVQGNAVYSDAMLAALFKIAQRFKAGVSFSPGSLYMNAKQQTDNEPFIDVNRKVPYDFRCGIAMYPVNWAFFFADLEYQKYPDYPQPQPGFFLGGQLNQYGPLPVLSFMPRYGMTMISAGYSHEPYNRITNTQARYFSLGAGYFLDNIYVRWSLRINVEPKAERNIVIGSPEDNVRLTEYSLLAPLFLTVGYRF